MIAEIIFWTLTGGGTLASAVYLLHQQFRALSPAERRIRALRPLSNGRRQRR